MATQFWTNSNILSTLLLLSILLPLSISQPPSPPAPAALPPSPPAPAALAPSSTVSPEPAPAPDSDSCNGLFLSYIYTTGHKLPPENKTHQAYRFESILTVLNNDMEELKSWKVFVGFQHEEILVSASGAIFADGSSFPASVENGTVFAGFPKSDLETAIATAGDLTQMQIQIKLVGTQFGVKSPDVPMPVNISLANDGFICSDPTLHGKRVMEVCCTRDPDAKTNTTLLSEQFLPRQSGDLTMMYDILRTYDTNYLAQVTIANHHQLGRLDNWELSWDWMKQEFINTMRGAYPTVVDATGCIYGPQSTQYASLDFANVLNCERRPTIIDLPPTKAKDPTLGLIPHCCRNGTILPPSMDPDASTSVFQIQVFKMPPDLNKSELSPPQNWRISGSLNPDYVCGPPVRVSPSEFLDPNGLSSNSTAFASWQVVCNITQRSTPRCCVSFSAFYNESVVPCRTCACGCPQTNTTCSSTAPAILLPSEALLVPFENRTSLAVAWADINHQTVPNPKPCGDGCGVSINWHVNTDYSNGWTARVTLFNWEETTFADWFAAAEMDKAGAGFEAAYSFNGTMIDVGGGNNTIFLKGLPGLNYLMGETDGLALKSTSRVPGKQQTVISFKKKKTPGINVAAGDGFPSKVYFNGEECSLPTMLPMSSGGRIGFSWFVLLCVVLLCLLI